jgi:hypothetical protein
LSQEKRKTQIVKVINKRIKSIFNFAKELFFW